MSNGFHGTGAPTPPKGNKIETYPQKTCNLCGETFKRLPAHLRACSEV